MSDEILFVEDDENDDVLVTGNWKLLIVDDEPEVHAVTKLALGDFVFQDQGLEFLSAYDGEQAKKIMRETPDIAVVLLDVVMETDDAGLKVADYIRNQLANNFVRIILRTGQPGQAPERDVIINYDINDYKSKTELTAQKLFTVVIAALRSYRDINSIDENRQGLEKIISASADLFSILSLENFIEGVMQQLCSLLGGIEGSAYLASSESSLNVKPDVDQDNTLNNLYVFAGKGVYEDNGGDGLLQLVSGSLLETCQLAYKNQTIEYNADALAAYCKGSNKHGSLLVLAGLPRELKDADKRLVEMFTQNVQCAFENVMLTRDIENTQREVIDRVGKAMAHHFGKGKHIQRMVKICDVLGRNIGLTQTELNTLCLVVPLHDMAKVKTLDGLPLSASSIDRSQLTSLYQQPETKPTILNETNQPLINTAALIARDHYEFWNGGGYPRGKSGEDIHIFCRITALADAYDVLRNPSDTKPEWSRERVVNFVEQQKGLHFDPSLVEVLLANLDEIESIIRSDPDFVASEHPILN
jgi:response regulator RpfG family c-di-GMP phosphodiesterase